MNHTKKSPANKSCMTYAAAKRSPKPLGDALVILIRLKGDLEALGFGTDEDISGADAIDVINRHWSMISIFVESLK